MLKVLLMYTIPIWFFPPIRHFKRKYFLFFLILALIDPIRLASVTFFKYALSPYWGALLHSLLVCSLLKKPSFKKEDFSIFLLYIILLLPIVWSLFNYIPWQLEYVFILFYYMFLIVLIMKDLIVDFTLKGNFDLFLIALMFYLFASIIKHSLILFGVKNAIEYFIFTSFFQAGIGLYFSIVRDDQIRFPVKP